MSWEIVKGIQVRDCDGEKQVWIKSDSNNVFPKHFHWWHCSPLTKVLREGGQVALDKAILRDYWAGNFQKTNNNYQKAIRAYCNYDKFGWNSTDDLSAEERKLKYEEIDNHLYECYLKYNNRTKGKFILKDEVNKRYFHSRRGRYIYFTDSNEKAKVFKSREEAIDYVGRGSNLSVVKID